MAKASNPTERDIKNRTPSPTDRLITALEDKKKRLQHKLNHRIQHFTKQTQEGSRLVTQQQIDSINELIKKLKEKQK